MSSYVKKVHFKLHESYANPLRGKRSKYWQISFYSFFGFPVSRVLCMYNFKVQNIFITDVNASRQGFQYVIIVEGVID